MVRCKIKKRACLAILFLKGRKVKMPELPEVESVKRGLNKTIVGCTIKFVEVFWDRIISKPKNVTKFKQRLTNQTFEKVERRGKFLLFYLNEEVIISHLRMEGKYFLFEKNEPKTKHTHVIFHLDNGEDLRYLDVRKFGRMSLVKRGEEFNDPSLIKLGPEPKEEFFTYESIHPFLLNKTKAIKSILLDQQLVVGIGNIYADEILFRAKIHPETPAGSLTENQEKSLHQNIIKVMRSAVKAGGTTIRTYANAFGKEGNYQNKLLVYGKDGTPCQRCGTIIKKIKVNGRGTHYCPRCQKEWGK